MFLLLQFSFTCFLIMRNFVLEMFVCPWHVMLPWHVFDIPYFPYWKLLSALEHSGACVIDALHWAASHGEALVVRDLAYVRNVLAVVVCSWSCMMFLILRHVRRCDRTGSRFCCCSTAWDGHSWHSTVGTRRLCSSVWFWMEMSGRERTPNASGGEHSGHNTVGTVGTDGTVQLAQLAQHSGHNLVVIDLLWLLWLF